MTTAEKQRQVLLAEDNEDIRNLLRLRLEMDNYQVFEAADGQQAFSVLQANPDLDLLITDSSLPYISGSELCKKIRGQDKWKELPILFFSGYAMSLDSKELLKLGHVAYLTKGAMWDEITATINQLLQI